MRKPRATQAAFATTSMELLMDLRRKERGASEGTLFVVKKWLSGGVGSISDILELSRSASTISTWRFVV
jgi:hypothetical protein